MGIAREYTRATILKRKLQAKRNAEALADEAARLEALAVHTGYNPKRKRGRPRKVDPDAVPENKMLPDPVAEDKISDGADADAEADEKPDLTSLPWASPQAYNRALALNLTPLEFEGATPTGKGGFTAGDVAAVAKESRSNV